MRTLGIMAGGLLLLGGFIFIGHGMGGQGTDIATLAFLPVWFAIAAANMWVGVRKAGYTISEEVPIFLAIFAVPAAAALAWWKLA